jgi:hypothetical protein
MRDVTSEQPTVRSADDAPDLSRAVADLEPLGGDPPCWAHLFEDDDEQAQQSGER